MLSHLDDPRASSPAPVTHHMRHTGAGPAWRLSLAWAGSGACGQALEMEILSTLAPSGVPPQRHAVLRLLGSLGHQLQHQHKGLDALMLPAQDQPTLSAQHMCNGRPLHRATQASRRGTRIQARADRKAGTNIAVADHGGHTPTAQALPESMSDNLSEDVTRRMVSMAGWQS